MTVKRRVYGSTKNGGCLTLLVMKSVTLELPKTEAADTRTGLDLTREGTPERQVHWSTKITKSVVSFNGGRMEWNDLTHVSKVHRFPSNRVRERDRASDVRANV